METQTASPAEVIREEHAEILKHLEDLRTLADRAERMPDAEFGPTINRAVAFLRDRLLPHVRVEEAVVYPILDDLLRSGGGTRTMAMDHAAVGSMVNELEEFRHAAASDVVRHRLSNVAAQLDTLLRLHLQKEEQVYLPLLAGLSAEAAYGLWNGLHAENSANRSG